jgi:hypothetical protein
MMPITNTTNHTTYDYENDRYDYENDPVLASYIDIIGDGAVALHILQITKDGELYLIEEGPGDFIQPLTREVALQWLMDHGAGQEKCSSRLDELFPTTMVVSIRVPKDLWERRRQAIRAGRTVPVNRLVTQLLEQELEKHTAA